MQILIQRSWGGARDSVFLTSSQVMLLLLEGPHGGNYWVRPQRATKTTQLGVFPRNREHGALALFLLYVGLCHFYRELFCLSLFSVSV